MHIQRRIIENVRSIEKLEIDFGEPRAGWHVLLGDNGSGKSSVIRALALALVGPAEVAATRQSWQDWIRNDAASSRVVVKVMQDTEFDRWTRTGRQSRQPVELTVEIRRSEGTRIGKDAATEF